PSPPSETLRGVRSRSERLVVGPPDKVRMVDKPNLVRAHGAIDVRPWEANPRHSTDPADQRVSPIRFEQLPLKPFFLLRAHHGLGPIVPVGDGIAGRSQIGKDKLHSADRE